MVLSYPMLVLGQAGSPTGAQILAHSQQAYDAVKTLQESVSGTIGGLSGGAIIKFQRPNKMAISGKSLFGSLYHVVSDGAKTYVSIAGNWKVEKDLQSAIAEITGISANAGTAVPCALVHAPFGDQLTHPGPSRVTMAMVGSRKTYKVDFAKPFPTSLWIDAKTYFLVKTTASVANRKIIVTFDPPTINQSIASSAFARPKISPIR